MLRKFVSEIKLTSKCSQCDENHPATLDFHHVDKNHKDFSISEAYKFGSLTKLKNELDKCVILCSNCHRKLHWREFA